MNCKSEIKVEYKPDGVIQGIVRNSLGKVICNILSRKKDTITKITKQRNQFNKTVEVIHSAWDNKIYHQDMKFPKEVLMDEVFCQKKFKEKQNLRAMIKKIFSIGNKL